MSEAVVVPPSPERKPTCQLALIPLHPSSTRKNDCKDPPKAKDIPLTLGRTDLADWWWNSCGCQEYCRFYCRPVAQNVKGLSKVMVMIDSEAKIHVVGRNPQLITIIPERDDNILQVNDVINIGRRDREPWMRLQVIKSRTLSNRIRKQPYIQKKAAHRRSASASSSRSSFMNKRTSTSPPEWITTTLQQEPNVSKRNFNKKRRSSREYSNVHQFKYHQNEKVADPSHLLMQDYSTSALLLEATQRKTPTKKENIYKEDHFIQKREDIFQEKEFVEETNDPEEPRRDTESKELAESIHSLSQQDASMLSLPKCASSSLDQNVDDHAILHSNNYATAHQQLSSVDPETSLYRWRDIVETENGNPPSFRHALASLILAKNENLEKGGTPWLPDLLESGFKK